MSCETQTAQVQDVLSLAEKIRSLIVISGFTLLVVTKSYIWFTLLVAYQCRKFRPRKFGDNVKLKAWPDQAEHMHLFKFCSGAFQIFG